MKIIFNVVAISGINVTSIISVRRDYFAIFFYFSSRHSKGISKFLTKFITNRNELSSKEFYTTWRGLLVKYYLSSSTILISSACSTSTEEKSLFENFSAQTVGSNRYDIIQQTIKKQNGECYFCGNVRSSIYFFLFDSELNTQIHP